MTYEEYIRREVAEEILDLINRVCFSRGFRDYRIKYGSKGEIDLIKSTIEKRYLTNEKHRCGNCRHFIPDDEIGHYCDFHTTNAGEECSGACYMTENDFCSKWEKEVES